MELGLTIPLQKHLNRTAPPYGGEADSRFCWDLHVISLRGRSSLLAVHSYSRYTFVLFNLNSLEWAALEDVFLSGLRGSLSAAGSSENVIQSYLHSAGACRFTKTHGRREVAFLNRAWEDVLALDWCLDETSQEQLLLDHAVNATPSRCAGFEGISTAAARLPHSLASVFSCNCLTEQ